jgi:HNH endonuclease
MSFFCEEIVPPKAVKTRGPLSVRFWRKVNQTGACWIWGGAINNKGYGCIGSGGRGRTNLLAHRVSWEINKGQIPDDMIVMHICDNPPCVNPEHLRLGSMRDNQKDMMTKGRGGGQFPSKKTKVLQDAAYYRAYRAKRKLRSA